MKDCLHRFCVTCIERVLRTTSTCVCHPWRLNWEGTLILSVGHERPAHTCRARSLAPRVCAPGRRNNECPACRVHIKSRRQLQKVRTRQAHLFGGMQMPQRAEPRSVCTQDPLFDKLVAALYGDVAAYEQAEEEAVQASNAAHKAEWARRAAAFAEQRARAGLSVADTRPTKRPKWGDAFDDIALQDLQSEEEDEGVEDGGAGRAAGRHRGGEYDPGPYAEDGRQQQGGHRGGAAGRMGVPPAPPPTFPHAVALGRAFSVGLVPTTVHMELRPLRPASVPQGCLPLPPLATPHLCVPAAMQAAKLAHLLCVHVDFAAAGIVPQSGQGAIKLKDSGVAVPDWMSCLALQTRADACGFSLVLDYYYDANALPHVVVAPPPAAVAPPPPAAPVAEAQQHDVAAPRADPREVAAPMES